MTTKKDAIRAALLRGEVLTPLVALNKYRVFALSQRIGELKREGLPIESTFAKGQPYKLYFIRQREGNQMELAA